MPARRDRQARRPALALLTASALLGCLDAPDDPGAGGDGDEPVQLLVNPSFEEGVSGWVIDGSIEVTTSEELSLPPSGAGLQVALLGRGNGDMDTIYQELTVPAWATSLELSGVRCFSTVEPFEAEFDQFVIYLESVDRVYGVDVMEASNLDASAEGCAWSSLRYATAPHAGEKLRFVVEAIMDGDAATSFAIDGLALTASR